MIRECSEYEALKILREPTVLKNLDKYPDALIDCEKYIINNSALAVVMPEGDYAWVHIAIPFRGRAGMREPLLMFIEWLRNRGFKGVYTNTQDDRPAMNNMAKRLGFTRSNDGWRILWE